MAAETETAGAEQARFESAAKPAARIFVALRIASDIAQELVEIARPLERFSIRPIAPADIHLTLVPPWNEAAIPDAVEKMGRAANLHPAFTLDLRHVRYGPTPRRPNLLWVECAIDAALVGLHDALLRIFGQTDDRPFRPHITLARLRDSGTRIARKCPIDREIALKQDIRTVELMQSPLPGERGYRVLASLPLTGDQVS